MLGAVGVVVCVGCGPSSAGTSSARGTEAPGGDEAVSECQDPAVADYGQDSDRRFDDGRAALNARHYDQAIALLMPVTRDDSDGGRQQHAQLLALDALLQRSKDEGHPACWNRAVAEAHWVDKHFCDTEAVQAGVLCQVSRKVKCEDGLRRTEVLVAAGAYAAATDALQTLTQPDTPCAQGLDRVLIRAATVAEMAGDSTRAAALWARLHDEFPDSTVENTKP